MALDLNDEVSEEFLKEIRKIAKKYSSGFDLVYSGVRCIHTLYSMGQ